MTLPPLPPGPPGPETGWGTTGRREHSPLQVFATVVLLVVVIGLATAFTVVQLRNLMQPEPPASPEVTDEAQPLLPSAETPAADPPVVALSASEIAARYGDAVWRVEAVGCGVESVGTAFVVGPSLLLTNWHVTVNTTTPRVVSRDGTRRLDAVVVGWSPDPDIAVLAVSEPLGAPLLWADPADLVEGEELVTLGYPVPDHTFAVTRTMVMSFMTQDGVRRAIRTDGLVDQGNSGGPALTTDGRVAGVVTELAGSQGYQLFPVAYTYPALHATVEHIVTTQPGGVPDCDAFARRLGLP